MPVLVIFVLLPLIEIALFIAVGGRIGVGLTLLLIVASAVLGVSILRGQQARALAMMQGGMRVVPGTFLAQGAFRVLSGLLLLVPGFLTDVIGLVLLIPPLQRAIVRRIGARATVSAAGVWQQGDIVEGEYIEGDTSIRDPAPPEHRLDQPRGH